MMKRGFIDWDKGEISEEDFQKRKEKITGKMAEEGLQYLLVHGDVWQCDNLQYLSNFNTYTRDCLLVLSKEGKLSLVSSMTPRDREWIAGFTPVASQDISFAAGLVKGSDVMKKGGFSSGKVGLVGEFFPKVLFDHLKKEFPQSDFVDLSEWYKGVRGKKDSAEIRLVKRAALLAVKAGRVLNDPGTLGKKETELSAQAEWIVRSQGGEDYRLFCDSAGKGYLDFPKVREVKDYFAYSLLTQYKGCWATLDRTWVSPKSKNKRKEAVEAYEGLVSSVQAEGSLDSLDKRIKETKAKGWTVEIKSPIGPDTASTIVSGFDQIPREKDLVFSLSFQKEMNSELFTYGETVYIGEEGYEVWTQ